MERAGRRHRGQSPHLPGPSTTPTAAAAAPPSVVVDVVMQCNPPTSSAVVNAVMQSRRQTVVGAVLMKVVDSVEVRHVDAKLCPDNSTQMLSAGASTLRVATTSPPHLLGC